MLVDRQPVCQLATHHGKIWIGDQRVVIGSPRVLKQSVFICPACQNTRYKLCEVAGHWPVVGATGLRMRAVTFTARSQTIIG
jgi:hypothetical protein